MADAMSVEDWKIFLKARIAQEAGKDAEALEVFDRLLTSHPSNSHLNASRAFALERLGRGEEAAASRLASKYSALARSLSGDADEAEAWIQELKGLLGDAEALDAGARLAGSAMMAW